MGVRIGKDPVQLGTSDTQAYAVSTGKQSSLLEIALLNTDTIARTPTVYLVPSGQAAADQYRIMGGTASVLDPGVLIVYRLRQFLAAQDEVRWKADAAGAVTAFLSAVEEVADAAKYVNVAAQFLGTGLTTLRTVATGRQATLIEVVLHNIDTVSRLATVHLVPSGGSASNGNMIHGSGSGSNLVAGETRVLLFNQHRGGGVTIQAKADAANKVTAKLSVLEETTT